MIAQFEVYGTPAPQGSKVAVIGRDNKPRVLESSSKTGRKAFKDWRADVKSAAEFWMLQNRVSEPVTSPVHLYIIFRFNRPVSYPKRKTKYGVLRHVLYKLEEWHPVKPDLDKLIRNAFDGLKEAGLYRDDALVCGIHAYKVFVENGRPGATIGLRIPVEPHEFPFPLKTGDRHDLAS